MRLQAYSQFTVYLLNINLSIEYLEILEKTFYGKKPCICKISNMSIFFCYKLLTFNVLPLSNDMQVRLIKELYGNQIGELYHSLPYHMIEFVLDDFDWLVHESDIIFSSIL
jgi:hypothetical protein